jgi:hypothetical protein
MSVVALGLLPAVEFMLVLWLGVSSIWEYLTNQDPLSGTVYYAMLGMFAVMPLLVARKAKL